MHTHEHARAGAAPAATGAVSVGRVPFDAPWNWLAAGWRDLWAAPSVSLTYGAIFVAVSAALAVALRSRGLEALVLSLGGGFLLVGPRDRLTMAAGSKPASRSRSATF